MDGFGHAYSDWEAKNKLILAKVTSVDNVNGVVILDFLETYGGGKSATINMGWVSFPLNKRGAWFRYIPHVDDIVILGFDFKNKPYIVGFDAVASDPTVLPDKRYQPENVGWTQFTKLNETVSPTDPDINKSRFSKFDVLESGEYDIMSTGGAYISAKNDGSYNIKCLDEIEVHMYSSGNQRWNMTVFDGNTQNLIWDINKDGDWSVESSGDWTTKFADTTHESSGTHIIDCGNIKLGGASAIQPLILGTTYQSAEIALINAIGAFSAAVSSAIGVLSGAGAAAFPLTQPPPTGGPNPQTAAWTGAATPATTAMVTALGVLQGVIQAFNTAYPNYLSKVSKTE